MIENKCIDHGKGFDWGLASNDYAKYRDIYPKEFYQKIVDLELCVSGQTVLDLGTGTGVLPEICMILVQNSSGRISQKIKLQKQNGCRLKAV